MPEGDTIHRTAATLSTWLGGRVVTAARAAPQARVEIGTIVGATITTVTAVGKHLLMECSGPSGRWTLRTHQRMTGSWHVYPAGVPWQRPPRQARLVIEAGDRIAVLFNAPVIELTPGGRLGADIDHLGPDILGADLDVDAIVARARAGDPSTAIGELLLDQRVASGIGNIYRCESMFLERVDPFGATGDLTDAALRALIIRAHRLMSANLAPRPSADGGRDVGRGAGRSWVHRRAGRPCLRCDAPIRSQPQGTQARVVYWCPRCQAPVGAHLR
jgi:endonuclease-8